MDPERVLSARRLVQSVYTDERIKEYVLDLVGATRRPADAGLRRPGAADRVRRLAAGGDLPAPGGQGARLHPRPRVRHARRHQGARRWTCCAHRVILTYRADAEGVGPDALLRPDLRGGAGAMTPEEAAREVRRIEITTRHLVRDIVAGEYSSAFRGRGVEFAEVREYQPGDDVRTIDWNVTARLGAAYVKRYLEERELIGALRGGPERVGRFRQPAPHQGRARRRGGRRAGARGRAQQRPDRRAVLHRPGRVPPRARQGPPPRAPAHQRSARVRARRAPAPTWPPRSPSWSRRSAGAPSSSFSPISWRRATRRCLPGSSRRHDVVGLQLVDPRERELPAAGHGDAVGSGDRRSGAGSTPATRRVRAYFARRAGSSTAASRRALRERGADLLRLETGRPYAEPLLTFFRRRERMLWR